jgi:hypothetical protein
MAEHARFTIDTGVAVYFCDPEEPLAAVISLDIADRSVRTSLTLAAPAGWDAGGLIAAGWCRW